MADEPRRPSRVSILEGRWAGFAAQKRRSALPGGNVGNAYPTHPQTTFLLKRSEVRN
jgi:hypothetical protein